MKRTGISIMLLLATLFIYSCGSEYTKAEASDKSAEVYCNKIFTCKEGEPIRVYMGGTEEKCSAQLKKEDDSYNCENGKFDGALAYDCINCIDDLSCSEFIKDGKTNNDLGKLCPACKELDDICKPN